MPLPKTKTDMTRKDYVLIADAIKHSADQLPEQFKYEFSHVSETVYRTVISRLSAALKAENPQFDADRFSKACGL